MRLNLAKCAFRVSSGKFLSFIIHQRGIDVNPEKIRAIMEMMPPHLAKELQCLIGKLVALALFLPWSGDKCLPFF